MAAVWAGVWASLAVQGVEWAWKGFRDAEGLCVLGGEFVLGMCAVKIEGSDLKIGGVSP